MATNTSQLKIAELESIIELLKAQLNVVTDDRRKLRYQCVQYSDAVNEVVKESYKALFKAEYKRGWNDAMDSVVTTTRTYPKEDSDGGT